jgi:hypothetical protein
MSTMLSFPANLHEELLTHLLHSDEEQVAFLFTQPPVAGKPLRISELLAVLQDDFDHQSAYHVALADEVRGTVIRRAWQFGACIVEAHSHVDGDPASFSRSDLAGFRDWVPHVRWRLGGRTYVALVFADHSFDALVWEEGHDRPGSLAGVAVDGTGILKPTGITLNRLSRGRNER